jgi:hypothetical protein
VDSVLITKSSITVVIVSNIVMTLSYNVCKVTYFDVSLLLSGAPVINGCQSCKDLQQCIHSSTHSLSLIVLQ